MSKSCKGLALELVKCLSESPCMKFREWGRGFYSTSLQSVESDKLIIDSAAQEGKRSYRDCAGEKVPVIPSECVGLRETYYQCKRGQVDMRTRIRGNKGY